MTLTAIFPVEGGANGRLAVEDSEAHAASSISAFNVVLEDLVAPLLTVA